MTQLFKETWNQKLFNPLGLSKSIPIENWQFVIGSLHAILEYIVVGTTCHIGNPNQCDHTKIMYLYVDYGKREYSTQLHQTWIPMIPSFVDSCAIFVSMVKCHHEQMTGISSNPSHVVIFFQSVSWHHFITLKSYY